MLDWGSKGWCFETRQSHCVVFLSKTPYPLPSAGSTQEDRKSSRHDRFFFYSDVDLERKLVIIFLSISLNRCFGCSKEPSH